MFNVYKPIEISKSLLKIYICKNCPHACYKQNNVGAVAENALTLSIFNVSILYGSLEVDLPCVFFYRCQLKFFQLLPFMKLIIKLLVFTVKQ